MTIEGLPVHVVVKSISLKKVRHDENTTTVHAEIVGRKEWLTITVSRKSDAESMARVKENLLGASQ